MLEVRQVSKRYRSRTVVRDISFVLQPGEITGYLGPNGAGKSTTARMLAGLLPPNAGRILFEGEDIGEDIVRYKRRIGYVPEQADLYPYMTAPEYLQLVGRLRCLPEKALQAKITPFLKLFSLFRYRHTRLGSFSQGMRQKVMIAAALLHDPDVLIFDEPLTGLDVSTVRVFRSLLTLLAREGKTILYSSHILDVVERTCSRVVILDQGRIVADDSLSLLRKRQADASLEEVFARLVVQDDGKEIARQVVDVMHL